MVLAQGLSRVCSHLKVWLGEDPLPSSLRWLLAGCLCSLKTWYLTSHRASNMNEGKRGEERWREKEHWGGGEDGRTRRDYNLFITISEVTSYNCCYILFERSKSLSPATFRWRGMKVHHFSIKEFVGICHFLNHHNTTSRLFTFLKHSSSPPPRLP